MGQSLQQRLAEYPTIMLEGICEAWHLPLTDERHEDVVARLATEMLQPQALDRIVQSLSPQERDILAVLASRDQTRSFVITRRHGGIRRLGPGRLEWEKAWREPATPVERLWFLGLVYRNYGLDEAYRGEVLEVPPEIRALLPRAADHDRPVHLEAAPSPARAIDQGDALARDLFVVISHVRSHPIRVAKNVLPPHEVKNIIPRLHGPPEPQRLSLLQRLGVACNLIQERDKSWSVTEHTARWLRSGPVQRQRGLLRQWLGDSGWNELCWVPHLRCEPTGWQHDPTAARKTLLRHLAECPTGVWLDIQSLISRIYELDPDFARPDGDYDSWYIRDARTGRYLTGFRNWDLVDGAWLRYVVEHSLLWLGVVSLGIDEASSKPLSFQVTPAGARILAQSEERSQGHQPMIVRPTMEVWVPQDGNWYDRFLLERFARWRSNDPGGWRYALDRDSVRHGKGTGISTSQMLAFLRRVTRNRLPARAVALIQSWAHDADQASDQKLADRPPPHSHRARGAP